jgi:phage terminase large subunit GpA-like protein
VKHDVLPGDPGATGPGSVWLDHDALLADRFTTDDGRTLVCEACAVDSGGHFTEQVYVYCARRRARRVWAIKGVGGPGRLAWPKRASRGGRRRLDVWPIGVDTIKDVLYGQLKFATAPGPGYTHFDGDTADDYIDQLLSETLVYRQVNGRRVKAWKPKNTNVRQEALDCWVYAFAAMVGRGGADLIGRRARVITTEKSPTEPAAKSALPAEQFRGRPTVPIRWTRGRNWVTNW